MCPIVLENDQHRHRYYQLHLGIHPIRLDIALRFVPVDSWIRWRYVRERKGRKKQRGQQGGQRGGRGGQRGEQRANKEAIRSLVR